MGLGFRVSGVGRIVWSGVVEVGGGRIGSQDCIEFNSWELGAGFRV